MFSPIVIREDEIGGVTSEKSKKRKKAKVKFLKSLERDENMPVDKIKGKPSEDLRKGRDGKRNGILSHEREKEKLNHEATHSDKNAKQKKRKRFVEEGTLEKSKTKVDAASEADHMKKRTKSKNKKKEKVGAENTPESNPKVSEVQDKKQDKIKEKHEK